MMFTYLSAKCQAIFTGISDTKRAISKIVPKLQNFEQKQRRMDIAKEMLPTFNYDSNLFKKVTTDGCMAMTLKPKPTHPPFCYN